MADYIYSMETRLTPDQQRGVNLVQEIARRAGLNLYLTGGTIRDLVTGFPIRDIDLSIQGNPLKLQKDLEKAGISVQGVDEDLRTLHLLMPGNVRAELNMTRSESLRQARQAARITPATINEDLRRRDFTVNAMALSLNPGSRGLLLDPFNGIADIEAKVLRVLHNYAFLEDPVRLIRATRLSARFHWPLEERTQARYDSAKENNYIEYIGKRSIGYELEQLAHEEDPLHIMRALEKEGWLKVLHPHWTHGQGRCQRSGASGQDAPDDERSRLLGRDRADRDVLPHSAHERQGCLRDPAHDSAARFRGQVEAPGERRPRPGQEADQQRSRQPSGSWKILTNADAGEHSVSELTTRNQAVDQKLKNFFGKWRQVKEKLPFPEMAELRITPQLPEYQKILDEAFLLLLDGKLRSHTEIMNFLKPYEPPPPPPPPPRQAGKRQGRCSGRGHRRGSGSSGQARTQAQGCERCPRPQRLRLCRFKKRSPQRLARKPLHPLAAPPKTAPVVTAKKAPAKTSEEASQAGSQEGRSKKPAAKKTAAKKAPAKKPRRRKLRPKRSRRRSGKKSAKKR